MHSFEVHSNESACRKKACIGLEQVFTGHATGHSMFNTFLTKFHFSKIQTLKFRNMKFEKNCSYIGGVDTYPPESVAILLNPTIH